MIRLAVEKDIPAIAETYTALLAHEMRCGSCTNWVPGVYPTVKVPMEKVPAGKMYVLEEQGTVCASMAVDREQAPEYRGIPWKYPAEDSEVTVIHTLCVTPALAGRGFGTAMVRFAMDLAAKSGSRVIRIDTWARNEPAKALYQRLGFVIAGYAQALHQGVISEELAYLEYLLPREK